MSELKRNYETKLYCYHSSEGGPFVYATLTDFEKGKGLLQIHSDWGTYSYFWGAMGERTIREFLLSASESYIENKLSHQLHMMGFKKESFIRLTKFMATCWPRVREMLSGQLVEVKAVEATS
jgi:hypothetical protein